MGLPIGLILEGESTPCSSSVLLELEQGVDSDIMVRGLRFESQDKT